eukprot:NODE_1355_length_1167_cov_304.282374.p1 GENE.NODE_1355_length_1167_cov_304.282374~~NODE_1355_length_1167_cov_304.282374.p1  ORF type:complete len:349 (-),score=76.71 NODE_1355_length_1167_cov_304.282374:104-1054(-)
MSILEAATLLKERVDAELRRIEDARREAETHRAQGIVEVEALRAAVEKDRAELEAEQRAMEVFNKTPDELVAVNAGGETFTARRSTLCQVEGSMLASMFSGRWDHSLAYDENGAAFVDASPRVFEAVLAHLRALRLDPRSEAPEVAPSLQAEVAAFREFMMLDVAACKAVEYVVVSVNGEEDGDPPPAATAEEVQRIFQPHPQPSVGGPLWYSCYPGHWSAVVLRFPRPCLVSHATLECCSGNRDGRDSKINWEVLRTRASTYLPLGRGQFNVSDAGEMFTLDFNAQHEIEPDELLTCSLYSNGEASFRKLSFFSD